MFELKIRTHFSAAHKILGHSGKCQYLHGHNWNVDVTVQSEELNDIGLAVDFADIKSVVNEVIKPLDHVNLNELPLFSRPDTNPTAENIAKHIFIETRSRLRSSAPQAMIKRVDIYETDTCSASYFESR